MIPFELRAVLLTAVIIYFIVILYFLKSRALQLKYTLLWLAAGIAMGLMVAIPELLVLISMLLGIESNMNALFIMGITFVVMIAMSLTSIVSKQAEKIKNLVQESARLEKRIRDLEQKLEAGEKE